MNVSEMLGRKAGLLDERVGGGIESGEDRAQRWGRLRGDLRSKARRPERRTRA
jgi:hypothetical protein